MSQGVVVGVFEITPVATRWNWWQFKNTLNDYVHKTFGTWEEVQEIALHQSDVWRARVHEFGPGNLRKNPRNGLMKQAAERAKARKAAEAERTKP